MDAQGPEALRQTPRDISLMRDGSQEDRLNTLPFSSPWHISHTLALGQVEDWGKMDIYCLPIYQAKTDAQMYAKAQTQPGLSVNVFIYVIC